MPLSPQDKAYHTRCLLLNIGHQERVILALKAHNREDLANSIDSEEKALSSFQAQLEALSEKPAPISEPQPDTAS